MRRLPLVLIAVLALAGFGGGAQKSAPLLGFVYAGGQSWRLAPIDPLTLSRRPGRSLSVGDSFSAWSYSPDRSKLVLGRDDIGGELLLVDTRRMRRLGLVDTGGMAQLTATFWPVETRVYAVVTPVTRQTDGNFSRSPTRLVAVDPLTRTVVGEQVLDGYVYGSAHGPGVLTLLLGQETGVGPARLAVVGSDGSVRTVGLDGVSVGYDGISEEGPALVGRYAQPGLAVAGDGTRAFVVTPGLVAAVDLRTLQVSYHPVGATGRRLQRVEKGSLDGSYRSALWARGGKLLVTGRDDHSSVDANGRLDYEARPAGLRLVDTRDWSSKLIDPNAAGASVGTDGMLVVRWAWNSKRRRSIGLGATIYTLDGIRRAHLFGRQDVFGLVVGRRAFIGRDASYTIVSTTTGRVLRKVPHQLPVPLLGATQDPS